MPTLVNPRHELFAQELASGKSEIASYTLAGYSGSRSSATRLAKDASICERVSEILQARADRELEAREHAIVTTGITKARVITELAKIGFANMQDYMKVGPSGDPVLDFSAITRDQAAALVEVTVEDFRDGRGDDARDVRRVKFKLADKKGALVDIGRELGMFINRSETKIVDAFDKMDEDELIRFLAEGGVVDPNIVGTRH